MKRALATVALFAIFAAFAAPMLLAVDHHGDDLTGQHADCDGDCGCMCHVGLLGVAKSEHHDILLTSAPAQDSYRSTNAQGIPATLDRPPKSSF